MLKSVNEKSNRQLAEECFQESDIHFYAKEYPEVIHLCKRALKFDAKYRAPYLRLGNIYAYFQRFDDALDNYTRYLKYSNEADDKIDISKAYNGLGFLSLQKRESQQALTHFFLSLEIVQNLKKSKEISRTYSNIALAYRLENNFEKANFYYHKAIEISKKSKDSSRVAYYYFNLSMMYKEQKKYFKAGWYMRKFKRLARSLEKKGILLNPSKNALSPS